MFEFCFRMKKDFIFLALLEARTEREIAGRDIYIWRWLRRKWVCLDRENDEYRYQTIDGEENVESNEFEQSGAAIEVIETSNVSWMINLISILNHFFRLVLLLSMIYVLKIMII